MKTSKIFAGVFIGLVAMFILLMAAGPGIMIAVPAGIAIGKVLKSSKALKEERQTKWDELNGILTLVKNEKRELTDEEAQKRTALVEEIKNIEKEITLAEDQEAIEARMAGSVINDRNQKKEAEEIQEYSFLKVVRSVVGKKHLDGLEAEMAQEAEKEAQRSGVSIEGIGIPYRVLRDVRGFQKRDLTAETVGQGGYTVSTDLVGFIDALFNKMILTEMGARKLTGLTGNVDIPRQASAASGTWEGENDANAESSQTFDRIQLTPHRLGTYSDISKQLIMQSSIDVEQFVRNDLERAVRLAIDLGGINGSGSANQPTGILNTSGIGSVVGGANGGYPDWNDIVNLEKEVAVDNADVGKLAYLTNPKVRARLKMTKLDEGSGKFVWQVDSKEINGYSVGVTTQVPSNLTKGDSSDCSALIFGNFDDLIIGQWGGLDLVIDPFTQATSALIRMVINSWWDVGVRHPESFAAMKDALT